MKTSFKKACKKLIKCTFKILFAILMILFLYIAIEIVQKARLLSKEELMELCEFTEEEISDVDLDIFIEEYQLTEEEIKKYNMHAVLRKYKDKLRQEEIIDERAIFYNYLVTNNKAFTKIRESQLDDVKVIALYINSGMEQESVIVDYQKNMIYYGTQRNILSDGVIPTWTEELTDEKKYAIRNMWEDCNIVAWKRRYIGQEDNTTGTYSWHLYLELESGKIKDYSGGYQGDVTPEGYGIMKTILFEWNVELVTVDYLIRFLENKEVLNGVDLEEFIIDNRITYDTIWEVDLYKLLEEYKQMKNI